jgi:ribosomal protein L19
MLGFLAEHALDRLDTRLCQNNSATVVGIGNGKRQAASLQLNVRTASQWFGVIPILLSVVTILTFGMSDSHPAKVDPGETFQGLTERCVCGTRERRQKILDSFVRDRRRAPSGVFVLRSPHQPDLDGVSQRFNTYHHSIEGVRVISSAALPVSAFSESRSSAESFRSGIHPTVRHCAA